MKILNPCCKWKYLVGWVRNTCCPAVHCMFTWPRWSAVDLNLLWMFWRCLLVHWRVTKTFKTCFFLKKNISDHYIVSVFLFQCRAVAKRLAIAEKSRETMTEELKLANQNITRLQVLTDTLRSISPLQSWDVVTCASVVHQDELSTTKRSYEDQLSMMSDHLCSMNDTLSKQRDEIDTLKLASKVRQLTLQPAVTH